MSAADKLAQVLAEHGNWGWAADNDGPDTRIRCGCGADLGEVSDQNEEVQALEADALVAAHIAPVVLAHLTAEGWAQGREEWGVRFDFGTSSGSPFTEPYRDRFQAEGELILDPLRRTLMRRFKGGVTDWEPVETGDQP